MKIYHTALGVCDTYEVVTEPPLGYIIWNIGDNAPEGYLPFCRLSARQPFPGGRTIETDTLRALKCDGWDIILDAIGFGPGNSSRSTNATSARVGSAKECVPLSRILRK